MTLSVRREAWMSPKQYLALCLVAKTGDAVRLKSLSSAYAKQSAPAKTVIPTAAACGSPRSSRPKQLALDLPVRLSLRPTLSLRGGLSAFQLHRILHLFRATNLYRSLYAATACSPSLPPPTAAYQPAVAGTEKFVTVTGYTARKRLSVTNTGSVLIAASPYARRYPLRAFTSTGNPSVVANTLLPCNTTTYLRDSIGAAAHASLGANEPITNGTAANHCDWRLTSPAGAYADSQADISSGGFDFHTAGVLNHVRTPTQLLAGYIDLTVSTTQDGSCAVYILDPGANPRLVGPGTNTAVFSAAAASTNQPYSRPQCQQLIERHTLGGFHGANPNLGEVFAAGRVVPMGASETKTFRLPLHPDHCYFNYGAVDPAGAFNGTATNASLGYLPENLNALLSYGGFFIVNGGTAGVGVTMSAGFTYSTKVLRDETSLGVAALASAAWDDAELPIAQKPPVTGALSCYVGDAEVHDSDSTVLRRDDNRHSGNPDSIFSKIKSAVTDAAVTSGAAAEMIKNGGKIINMIRGFTQKVTAAPATATVEEVIESSALALV